MKMSLKVDFVDFVLLMKDSLINSGVPDKYWENLHHKLSNEVYDAGDTFMIQKVLYTAESDNKGDEKDETKKESYGWRVAVSAEDGVSMEDPQHIYLIDHAWTYRVHNARKQLHEIPALLDRMLALMDLPSVEESESKDEAVQNVMENMWKYNQTYKLGNQPRDSEESTSIWYVMDEFGSRIQPSGLEDEPTVKIVPVYYPPLGCSFSIMWPLQNLNPGDEVTREYVDEVDPTIRRIRMHPWIPDDFSDLSYQLPSHVEALKQKYKMVDSLPSEEATIQPLPKDRALRLFCDVQHYLDFYHDDEKFKRVESSKDADILWIQSSFQDYKEFSEECPHQYFAQFPNERLLVVKDLLSIVTRGAAESGQLFDEETLETKPKWFQTCFDLLTEMKQFVSYYQNREKRGLDNTWIIKPWNLGRTLDVSVANDLDHILRIPDTGPKLVCKYIEDPVLYNVEGTGRVKFDLRVNVLLKSINPLEAYIHDIIVPRFAEKPFSLEHPDDLETHLSVLSYKKGVEKVYTGEEPVTLRAMDPFLNELEEQNPGFCWKKTKDDIYACIKECLQLATAHPAPYGVAPNPQSRALYGVDVMLKWCRNEKGEKYVQPVILEFNHYPDIWRPSLGHKELFMDILHTLFTDNTEGRRVQRL